MEPLLQAQIMIILTHIPHQWPYPHPFVSVAQNQVDFGDASPVSQWAPFVMGYVLALASLRRQCEIFAQWCARGRGWGGACGVGRGARGAQRGLSLSQGITSDCEQACALSKLHALQEKGMTCRKANCLKPLCVTKDGTQVRKHKKKKKKNLFCLANMSSSLALTDVANVTEKIYVNLLKTWRMPHEYSVKWQIWLSLNDQLLMESALPTYLFYNLPFRDITLNIHKLVNLKCFLN